MTISSVNGARNAGGQSEGRGLGSSFDRAMQNAKVEHGGGNGQGGVNGGNNAGGNGGPDVTTLAVGEEDGGGMGGGADGEIGGGHGQGGVNGGNNAGGNGNGGMGGMMPGGGGD